MRPRQNTLGGVAAGVIIIGLAFAFYFSRTEGDLFLPIFFFALAIAALLGSFVNYQPRRIYSGMVGATWLAGIGLCFLIGFWPWILLPVGVSMVLGALLRPITTGIAGLPMMASPPQPPYQALPYAPPATYQEGGREIPYPPAAPPATSQEEGQEIPYPQGNQPEE